MARGSAPPLSEYELQRQANIAERDALLKQLALDAASAGLAPKPILKRSTNADRSHKRKTLVKKVIEEVLPRRTSSRLAGLTADSEVAKRKAENEYVAVQEAARAKRQRVSGDLDLRDILVAGKQWDKSENFLVDVVTRGGKPYERTFGEREVEETSDKGLKVLREQMNGLELYEEFEPNSKVSRTCTRSPMAERTSPRNKNNPRAHLLPRLPPNRRQTPSLRRRQDGQSRYLRRLTIRIRRQSRRRQNRRLGRRR